MTTKISTFTNEKVRALHEQLHWWVSSCAPKLCNRLGTLTLPAESNEAVCPTFHCEESLGRSQGSLSHAGGSCFLPSALQCHWGGPGVPTGLYAYCSPWMSWRAQSGFQRGCFRCGHCSSWTAATRKGEEGRGAWEVLWWQMQINKSLSGGRKGLCWDVQHNLWVGNLDCRVLWIVQIHMHKHDFAHVDKRRLKEGFPVTRTVTDLANCIC